MNRKAFFAAVRNNPFGGSLSQGQVDGLNFILDAWEASGLGDPRWLAYMLATAFHETARTMQPIEEYGKGRGRKYGEPDPETGQTYYGRGYVQLTWRGNYEVMGQQVDLDLVNHPELALDPTTAARIMFKGMVLGLFTGRKLSDYLVNGKTDFYNARRIVNGTDRAEDIAGYARAFLKALEAAQEGDNDEGPVDTPPTVEQRLAALESRVKAIEETMLVPF